MRVLRFPEPADVVVQLRLRDGDVWVVRGPTAFLAIDRITQAWLRDLFAGDDAAQRESR
jgi:hypothetical protein